MNDIDKMDPPIFSVIIPAYNAEKFIHIAVKSVCEQTVDDWELIIVENGSTDKTTIVCENFLNDKRIKLLHSEKGVSIARNSGISVARGKWIVFLDADDQLLKDTLQKYLEIDNEYSPDLIVGEYEDKTITYTDQKKVFQNDDLSEFLHISLLNPTQKCNTTAVAFKNSMLQQYSIFFDPKIRYAEDSIFFLDMLQYAKKIVTVFSPVYRVIYNSQSAVRSGKRKMDREYLPAINQISTILNMSDPDIKNAWYIFIMNQILIIFVNDTFSRSESVRMQIKDAKELMKISEYKKAIENVDISKIQGMKKIVFKMMKLQLMPGILLAVRVRQRQNKKKENKFYV